MKIDVLGTKYDIVICDKDDDPFLDIYQGYTDRTANRIVVTSLDRDNSEVRYPEKFENNVLRHEIIHAFMFESGLAENADYANHGTDHPEMMVDWFAIQYPKIRKVFKKLGIEK